MTSSTSLYSEAMVASCRLTRSFCAATAWPASADLRSLVAASSNICDVSAVTLFACSSRAAWLRSSSACRTTSPDSARLRASSESLVSAWTLATFSVRSFCFASCSARSLFNVARASTNCFSVLFSVAFSVVLTASSAC